MFLNGIHGENPSQRSLFLDDNLNQLRKGRAKGRRAFVLVEPCQSSAALDLREVFHDQPYRQNLSTRRYGKEAPLPFHMHQWSVHYAVSQRQIAADAVLQLRS